MHNGLACRRRNVRRTIIGKLQALLADVCQVNSTASGRANSFLGLR